MQKDLKIGLAAGSGLVAVAVIWLATRPSLTPQARLAGARPRQAQGQNLHTADTGTARVMPPNARSPGASSRPRRPAPRPPEDPFRDVRQTSDERKSSPDVPRENSVSNIENPVPTIATELIKTEKFHIVRKGDTLSRISYKYYGTANKWQEIFEQNRNTISDADKLAIGIKLIIPD